MKPWVNILVLIGAVGLYFIAASSVVSNINNVELAALKDLYDSTDGSHWRWRNISTAGAVWNFSVHDPNPCSPLWQGLTCLCTRSCVITAIDLKEYLLRGHIPETIGNFSELLSLNLATNHLNHTIPQSIGSLVQLESLDFSRNFLRGTIPSSIGLLKHLTVLEIAMNLHTGTLSPFFFSMTSLRYLSLEANELVGPIPDSIGQLSHLEFLDLSGNSFTGTIPSTIGNLTKLNYFNLAVNHLNGSIPLEVCNMAALIDWVWHINFLTGPMPECIGQLENLNYLVLYQNKLTGTIPESIQLLNRTLLEFSIASNYFTGWLPRNIFNESKSVLKVAFLNNNSFSGPLPEIVLPGLLTFSVENNSFTGTLCDSIVQSELLNNLDVSYNNIFGTIPARMGEIYRLNKLILSYNAFTGPLPDLQSFQYNRTLYDVGNNLLTGTIPNSLCYDSRIYMDLGYNFLSGTIPDCSYFPIEYRIGSLKHFSTSSNLLSGPIPTYLQNEWKIRSLTLNNNLLTGTLPHLNCSTTLEYLYLQSNHLHGVIDLNANFSKIKYVDVSSNRFSGGLPDNFFSYRPPVLSFAASSNCIAGTIPSGICSAGSLLYLDLQGLSTSPRCRQAIFPRVSQIKSFVVPNHIEGDIPLCLFNMPMLQTLLISGNSIRWDFPNDDSLVVSNSLNYLAMSHNRIGGTVPYSITSNQWLSIQLDFNKLIGAANFVAQNDSDVSVNFQVNRLSGRVPSSMENMININILTGNLFDCNLQRDGLPEHDGAYSTYQCGSNSFNQALLMWLVCLGILLALLGIAHLHPRWLEAVVVFCTSIENEIAQWFSFFEDKANVKLVEYKSALMTARNSMCVFTAILLLGFLPIYGILTYFYKTVVHQYAWTISAAFLSGVPPAVTLMMFYIALIVCLYYLWYLLSMGKLKLVYTPPQYQEKRPNRRKEVCALVLVIFVNSIIIVLVNAGYVTVVLTCKPQVIFITQLVIAFFKLLWNDYAVKSMVKFARKMVPSKTLEKTQRIAEEMPYMTFIVLFNSIIAPCLATAAVDRNCFYNAFVAPAAVNSQFPIFTEVLSCEYTSLYNGQHCAALPTGDQADDDVFIIGSGGYNHQCSLSGGDMCTIFTQQSSIGVSYNPPFNYSYQCSSSILTNYAAVYVFMFLMVAFLKPIALYLMQKWYPRIPAGSCLHLMIDTFMYKLMKPPSLKLLAKGNGLFQKDRFSLRLIAKIAVLITFGVVFPPLTIVVCVAFVVEIYLNLVLVGRFLAKIENEHLRDKFKELLSRDCDGCLDLLISPVAKLVIPFAAMFYAFFVFDTYGDKVGYRDAIWAPFLLSSTPIMILVISNVAQYVIARQHEKKTDQGDLEFRWTEMPVVNVVHIDKEDSSVLGGDGGGSVEAGNRGVGADSA